jgi:hypothetical protein
MGACKAVIYGTPDSMHELPSRNIIFAVLIGLNEKPPNELFHAGSLALASMMLLKQICYPIKSGFVKWFRE